VVLFKLDVLLFIALYWRFGMTGISFVAWALPITIGTVFIAITVLNHFASQIEEWGRKHINNK
jgi:hypothetical protein